MSHPSAPWQLLGSAVTASYLIDTEIAQQFIPSSLDIVSILPGKTVANIYLSKYDERSTLQYHELIVAPGLVKFEGKFGAWISHIYVDNLDSVAGGKNIWGLPKQMADFSWNERQIAVSQGDLPLCRAEIGSSGLPLSPFGKYQLSGDAFGGLERDLLLFKNEFAAWLKWIDLRVEIDPVSPFSSLNLRRPLLSLYFNDLHLIANPPKVIGRSTTDLRVADSTQLIT
jgi:acetoacetate decarboxylase